MQKEDPSACRIQAIILIINQSNKNMKKIIYALSVITFFTAVILIGCESTDQKEETTEIKVEATDTTKTDANTVTVKTATSEEWKEFKTEATLRISENEKKIAELKAKVQKPGKLFDEMREKKIKNLELKNKELRDRIANYETTQSDWEKFKQEFNHDMDELGQAIKDLVVDNK